VRHWTRVPRARRRRWAVFLYDEEPQAEPPSATAGFRQACRQEGSIMGERAGAGRAKGKCAPRGEVGGERKDRGDAFLPRVSPRQAPGRSPSLDGTARVPVPSRGPSAAGRRSWWATPIKSPLDSASCLAA